MKTTTCKQVHDLLFDELEHDLGCNHTDVVLSSSEFTIRIDDGKRVIVVKVEEEPQ